MGSKSRGAFSVFAVSMGLILMASPALAEDNWGVLGGFGVTIAEGADDPGFADYCVFTSSLGVEVTGRSNAPTEDEACTVFANFNGAPSDGCEYTVLDPTFEDMSFALSDLREACQDALVITPISPLPAGLDYGWLLTRK